MIDYPEDKFPEIKKWVFEMPAIFALDNQNRVLIGCLECDYVIDSKHECTENCNPHPKVMKPLVIKVLPHHVHA